MRRKSAVLLVVVILSCLTSSCKSTPEAPPLESYMAALRKGYDFGNLQLADLPRYQLSLVAQPQERTLAGRLILYYRNRAEGELRELYFRLYPNMPAYGGDMRVLNVKVDGRDVPFVVTGRGVDLKVPLPRLLPVRGAVLVTVDFVLSYPRLVGQYGFFGESSGVAVLPDFYPMVALLKDGEWHLDSSPGFGDAVCTEVSLYQVEITLPPGFQAFGLGLPIERDQEEGQEVWRFMAGPARNLALVLASGYEIREAQAEGVRLLSAAPETDRSAMSAGLAHATAGISFFEELLGPLPQDQLWLVKVPLVNATVHASGALLIGQDYFGARRSELEQSIIRLLAWQWWGNKVGTDPLRDPWLAESLGQVCTHLYWRAVHGASAAETQVQSWREHLEQAQKMGVDEPLAQELASYGNLLQLQLLAEVKGPLFWLAFADLVGWQGLEVMLKQIQEQLAFDVANTDDVVKLLSQLTGPPGMPIIEKWILGS